MPSACDHPVDGKEPGAHNSRWLDVIDDRRGTLRIEFFNGYAFLHATFRKPVAAMRAARAYFPQIIQWLKSVGHDEVFVLIPEGDDLLYRFEQRFGFVECARREGHILMGQRI